MSPTPHPALLRELDLPTARGRFAGLRNGNAGAAPLLALHGWLDNAASFVPMAPFLAHYDLVAGPARSRAELPLPGRCGVQPVQHPAGRARRRRCAGLDALHPARAFDGRRDRQPARPRRPGTHDRLHLIEAIGPLAAPEDTTAERLRDAVSPSAARWTASASACSTTRSWRCARMQTNITTLDEDSARLLVGRGPERPARWLRMEQRYPPHPADGGAHVRDAGRRLPARDRLPGAGW